MDTFIEWMNGSSEGILKSSTKAKRASWRGNYGEQRGVEPGIEDKSMCMRVSITEGRSRVYAGLRAELQMRQRSWNGSCLVLFIECLRS